MKTVEVPYKGYTYKARPRTHNKTYKDPYFQEHSYADQTDLFIIKEMRYYENHLNFHKNDIWLDLGANIGGFGVIAHAKVNHIYGYEPIAENCMMIREQINFHGMTNYTLIQKAITDSKEKQIRMYVSNDSAQHTINGQQKRTVDIVMIDAQNLGDAIKKHKANKVKMDIEGAEWPAILNVDWSKVDELMFEWHSHFNKDRDGKKYNAILEHLRKFYEVKAPNKLWNQCGIIHCTK